MVSAATKANRLALGAAWLDSSDAARALGVQPKHLNEDIRTLVTHQSRSLRGRGARNVGWAYSKADIDKCAVIRSALGCTALRAAQLLFGIRRLGHLGLLSQFESQLPLSLPERAKTRARKARTA